MEDLKKDVKRLEEKLDSNVEMIINNMNKLHSHEEKINKNSLKIKENSYALEILKDYKNDKKKLFRISLILLIALVITMSCLIYVMIK